MASLNNPQMNNAIASDIPEIKSILRSLAKCRSNELTNLPTGAVYLNWADTDNASNIYFNWYYYNGSSWLVSKGYNGSARSLFIGSTHYSPNTGTTANTIPIRNASGQLPGDITGLAAKATQLNTARTIQLGGIASATAQSFNGTANITIPINSINVANANDNALVGIVSKAHGGTGRSDGAAADVVVTDNSGTFLATTKGQLGRAIQAHTTDLDTLIDTGRYWVSSGAPNHPYYSHRDIWGLLEVFTYSINIVQRLTITTPHTVVWIRWTNNRSSTMGTWKAMYGCTTGSPYIYISKSGSDKNTGLHNAYPCLTIARAVEVGNSIWQKNSTDPGVVFCFGEGNWGGWNINDVLPHKLYIRNYDNTDSTAYSSTSPLFTNITVRYKYVKLCSGRFDSIDARMFAYIECGSYMRTKYVSAIQGGMIQFSNCTIEIYGQTGYNGIFDIYRDGAVLLFTGTCIGRVIENIKINMAFLKVHGDVQLNGAHNCTWTVNSGVSDSFSKYYLSEGAWTNSSKAQLDSKLPGAKAGTYSNVRYSGRLYGNGNAAYYLNGAGAWVNDVVRTSTDQTIAGLKTLTSQLRIKYNYDQLRLATETDSDKSVIFRNDGANFHILVANNFTSSYNSARPFCINLSNGILYTTSPGAGSNDTSVTTTGWVRRYVASAVPTTAASATKLATARLIFGRSFDGTANVAGDVACRCVEFTDVSTTSNNGGYIDFHYNASALDYTARLIEGTRGTITYQSNKSGAARTEGDLLAYRDYATNTSSAVRGYCRLNNGMIIQWGYVTIPGSGSSGAVTTTTSLAYSSSSSWQVVATYRTASYSTAIYPLGVNVTANNSFTIYAARYSIAWFAIGV